ncbi:MAG TPA: dockerin type I domain-containing protein [Tepidisphaeraceae bacterium]
MKSVSQRQRRQLIRHPALGLLEPRLLFSTVDGLTKSDQGAAGAYDPDAEPITTIHADLNAAAVALPQVNGRIFFDDNHNGTFEFSDPEAYALVYADVNGNGIYDPSEPVATGGYGSYSLILPAAMTVTLRAVPGEFETLASPLQGIPLTVNLGDSLGGRNFIFDGPPVISGHVFNDVNGNRRVDRGETGVPGVQLWDDANENGLLDPDERTTTTDGNGLYAFIGPRSVSTHVHLVPPAGLLSEWQSQGFSALSAHTQFKADWGLTPFGIIAGHITGPGNFGQGGYLDLNHNGLPDPGEPYSRSTTGGFFYFNAPPGTYTLRLDLLPGYTLVSPASGSVDVTIDSQSYNSTTAFVLDPASPPGYVWGSLYEDVNRNGQMNLTDPPVAGRSVYLDLNNNNVHDIGEPLDVSDSSGQFAIHQPPPGTYAVRQILPPGWVAMAPFNGPVITVPSTGVYGTGYFIGSTDVLAPTVQAAQLGGEAGHHVLRLRFSDDVGASLTAADLTLFDRVRNVAVPISLTYDAIAKEAKIVAVAGGLLPNGKYDLTLAAGSVVDGSQLALASEYVYKFDVLAGDANLDGTVDFLDLAALAQNYNGVGTAPAQGDFNYDGRVDFYDLAILAQNYNTSLPATAQAITAAPQPTAAAILPTPAPGKKKPTVPVRSIRPPAVSAPQKPIAAISPGLFAPKSMRRRTAADLLI